MENSSHVVTDLIIKYSCQRIAEIGVERARCARAVLRNEEANKIVEEYWAIDSWKPLPHYLTLLEENKQFKRMGKRKAEEWKQFYMKALSYMAWFPQLKIVKLASKEAVTLFPKKYFPNGYFDIVYIDAEHTYEAVKQDIKLWWPLLRVGGILCGHDYWDGEESGRYPGVNQAVDELLGKENIKQLLNCTWLYKKRRI